MTDHNNHNDHDNENDSGNGIENDDIVASGHFSSGKAPAVLCLAGC